MGWAYLMIFSAAAAVSNMGKCDATPPVRMKAALKIRCFKHVDITPEGPHLPRLQAIPRRARAAAPPRNAARPAHTRDGRRSVGLHFLPKTAATAPRKRIDLQGNA